MLRRHPVRRFHPHRARGENPAGQFPGPLRGLVRRASPVLCHDPSLPRLFPGACVPGCLRSRVPAFPGACVPGCLRSRVPAFPGACVPGACVPGACVPGACVPGACVPGACVPGACVPGACVPGACVPGACVPGACVPGACVPGACVPRCLRSRARVSLVVATVGREHSAARPGRRQGAAGMLVIHGVWTRGALCLWAEDSALPPSPPVPAGGRPSRAARPHPFAAGPDALGDALSLLGDGLRDLAGKAAADELTLWLPSAGGAGGRTRADQARWPRRRGGRERSRPWPPVLARLLEGPRAGLRPSGRARDPGRPGSGGYSG